MSSTAELALHTGEQTASPDVRRILFVCTGNTCRSPMAAAWLNHMVRPREVCSACAEIPKLPPMVAASAGLYAVDGAPITPAAANTLREAGVVPTPENDYTAHRARTVTAEMMAQADEVIAISGRHAMELMMRFPEHAGKIETLPIDIADPYGGSAQVYRECLDMISYAITLRWCSGNDA